MYCVRVRSIGFGVEIVQVLFLGLDLYNFRKIETLAVDSSGLRPF